jgi:hypothetical protein
VPFSRQKDFFSSLLDLIRHGELESVLFKVQRGGGRTEYWIRRESINRWIANRDLELTRYMPRGEAQRTLGLKNITVTAVAQAGLIRCVKGPECYFPTGYHFLREDVIGSRRLSRNTPFRSGNTQSLGYSSHFGMLSKTTLAVTLGFRR